MQAYEMDTEGLMIMAWQNFLSRHEFYRGSVDGQFGGATTLATRAFQGFFNLVQDGVVGHKTLHVARKMGFSYPSEFQLPNYGCNGLVACSQAHPISGFDTLKATGVKAVFHNATKGVTWMDYRYRHRKIAALDHQLLWGAVHTGTAAPVPGQLDFFLALAGKDGLTEHVLHWIPETENAMLLVQAQHFVELFYTRMGRYPILQVSLATLHRYNALECGNLLECPLCVTTFFENPEVPEVWKSFRYWHFSDGEAGKPELGILLENQVSLGQLLFNGTADELAASWGSGRN